MRLNLTEDQRSFVKITFNMDRFVVTMGENDPKIQKEYYAVADMLSEFEENGIESADFDNQAHEIYKKALERAYNLSHALS